MAIRVLLDEDLPYDLTQPLRKRGMDARHVTELRDTVWQGRRRISDADVCAEVARQPTLLVTQNVRDYADHAFQRANVIEHRIAVLIVRVPKRESRTNLRPQAIHDIVHRWAHRAEGLQERAPLVASVNRNGIRTYALDAVSQPG
jgi:hypothetical protein